MKKIVFSSAVALAVSACGGDGGIASRAQADTSGATFVFDGSWGFHGEGTPAPGAVGTISYDNSRLPHCRATQDSVAAWAIVAFVSADGGDPIQIPLPSVEGVVSAAFEIPWASDLAFYFHATDDGGCSEWDSDYGQNFHFSIAQVTTEPIIHFASDFSTHTEGGIHAGVGITIDYDFRRLSQCREVSNGIPAWGITMFSQIDGGAVTATELDRIVDDDKFGQPVMITPPLGSETMSVWFENTDVYGCNAWDSDYGANYTFSLD
jgi:hypothetical protein